jgi:hypothetical protein
MLAFPEGNDLMRVMNELTGLCHLPERAAMDGNFQKKNN